MNRARIYYCTWNGEPCKGKWHVSSPDETDTQLRTFPTWDHAMTYIKDNA